MRLRRPRHPTKAEVNIAPLVDIILLLIIFCMTVTQMTKADSRLVTLPFAKHPQSSNDPSPAKLIINILASGALITGGRPIRASDLHTLLRRDDQRTTIVLLRTDRNAPWASAATVMRVCSEHNIRVMHIAVKQDSSDVIR